MTLVIAGAGYGKSCLLDQALADNRVRPAGLDMRIDVDRHRRTAESLVGSLLSAAGLTPSGDVDHDQARLQGWLVSQSPMDVCLVVDDVHEILGTPADALLARLSTAMPQNAHLVLAGRDVPAWSLTSTGSVLGQADLAFTPDELVAIADDAGLEVESLAEFGGWPALTAAMAFGRRSVAMDVALEEAFARLDTDVQRAVAALGVARRLPETVLERLVPGRKLDAVVSMVPLIERRDGDVIGHDLWGGVARDAFDARIAAELVELLVESNDFDSAAEIAHHAGMWEDADAAKVALVTSRMHGIPLEVCTRLTSTVPTEHRDGPGHRLLTAIAGSHRRVEHGVSDPGIAALLELADEQESVGSQTVADTTLGLALALAWIARDPAATDAVVRRVASARRTGGDWLSLVSGGIADVVHGRSADAAAKLHEAIAGDLPPAMRALVVRLLVTLLGVSGDVDGLRALDLGLLESSPDPHVRQAPMVVAWLSGDVDGVEPWRTRVPEAGHPRGDELTQIFFHAATRASWGDTTDLDLLMAKTGGGAGHDRGAIACRRAAAEAIVHVGLAQEDAAARVLADAAAGIEPGSLEMHELARSLCYPYVLVPELRPRLDQLPHGLQRRQLRVARWLVDLRAGRVPEGPLPSPAQIFLSLPLRWSCELASRSVDALVDGAEDLAHWLRTQVGPLAVDLLAGIDGAPDAPAGCESVRLRLLGVPAVEHDGVEAACPEWRRRRVRQLLAILALRRRMRRDELTAWLWPDLAPERGAANLRVTLTYARRVLSDHAVESPHKVLVDRDGILELVPHRRLSVDLWDFESAVADAGRAERDGDLDAAVRDYGRALDAWSGKPLVDLGYDDRAAQELRFLQSELCRTGTRCGELRLASGDATGATRAVEQVLALDPAWEPAHQLAIAVAVRNGDGVSVRRALTRSRDMLEGSGHRPGDGTVIARNLADIDLRSSANDVAEVLAPAAAAAALEQRWSHRLVELVAPRGAGKSEAIAAAVARRDDPGRHLDVCVEDLTADPIAALARTVTSLDGALHATGGSADPEPPASVDAAVSALVSAVGRQAPAQVCLVFDDADGLRADPTGDFVVRTLVADLPSNGHLLVASREGIGLSVAQPQLVGAVQRIDSAALCFDAGELDAVLGRSDRAAAAACFGWVGAVRAARAAGRSGVVAAVERVLDEVAEDVGVVVALAARLGGLDGAQLRGCGLDASVGHVRALIPFVRCRDDRIHVAPGLWELLESEVLDPRTVAEVRVLAAAVEEQQGRPNRALALLLDGSHDPTEVTVLVERAHIGTLDTSSPHWGRVRAALGNDGPAAPLAAAAEAHHRGDSEDAVEALAQAGARGLDPSVVGVNALFVAWCDADMETLENLARDRDVADHGDVPALARAALAAEQGSDVQARTCLGGLECSSVSSGVQAELQRRLLWGVGYAEPGGSSVSIDPAFISPVEWLAAVVAWAAGRVDPLATLRRAVDGDLQRVPAGCRGPVTHAFESLHPQPADSAGIALGKPVGDETWSPLRPLFASMVKRRNEMRARVGQDIDGGLRGVVDDAIVAALPITESIEVAGRLLEHRPDEGLRLLERIRSLCPTGFASASAGPLDPASAAALHAHHRHVHAPVRLQLLGVTPRLWRGGDLVEDGHWRRPQVRRIATLLAVASWSREGLAAELWPDASPTAAARSLRVSLHYLREALDPDRPNGVPSLLVSVDRDGLTLARVPGFEVDVRAIADLLDAAEIHRAALRHGNAAEAVRAAFGRWSTPGLELGALETPAAFVDRLRVRLVDALCDAGDMFAALGDQDGSMEVGQAAVALDPLCQHGYRLMIASCIATDRVATAREILNDCRQAFEVAELAVSPETERLARVLAHEPTT